MKYILFLALACVLCFTVGVCGRPRVRYTIGGEFVPEKSIVLVHNPDTFKRVMGELARLREERQPWIDSAYHYRDSIPNRKRMRMFLRILTESIKKSDSIIKRYDLQELRRLIQVDEDKKATQKTT